MNPFRTGPEAVRLGDTDLKGNPRRVPFRDLSSGA